MTASHILGLSELFNDFTVMLLDDNQSLQLLTVKRSQARSFLNHINIDITLLLISVLQDLNWMGVASRCNSCKFIYLAKVLMAHLSPLDLRCCHQELTFLSSNPIPHVTVLFDSSSLIIVSVHDSEQSLQSFSHADNELA